MLSDVKRLRALLAEARAELSRHVFTQESPACVNCGGESGFDVGRPCPYAADLELTERIDAELEKPEIEWTTDKFWGEDAVETCVDGVYVSVYPIEWGGDQPWNWTISRHEIAESGEAPTKAEAVAAALKAAGVK